MNEAQKFSLRDSVAMVRLALGKAQIMHEEIADVYLGVEMFRDADCLAQQAHRYAAFHSIISDLLNEMAANLPSDEGLADLPATKGGFDE